MKKEPRTIVLEFLTAVQQGDLVKLGEILHDNITWDQPGNSIVSGIKRSKAEVFQMVGTMFAKTENTLSLAEIKAVTVNGDQVACQISWKGKGSDGQMLDTNNIDLYTVTDGQITAAMIFAEDLEAEDRFWGAA
ncbi:nuclear transport factor 2 family protein [Flavitalea flava]